MRRENNNPEHLIAVICDDEETLQNLNIQLTFCCESCLPLSGDSLAKALKQQGPGQKIFAVVIAGARGEDIARLLTSVHQVNAGLPVILLGDEPGDPIPAASKPLVIHLTESPMKYQTLQAALNRVRQMSGLPVHEIKSTLISPTGTAMFRSLVGNSEVMRGVRTLIHQVAGKNVPVLVTGESGTGKEIAARNIHYHSGRWGKPFIAVNCATVTPEQFELEFYGQAAGYGGAAQSREGYFAQAHEGTLFLDGIGELPAMQQINILRFIESREFEPLGSSQKIPADVRIVAATNQNLQDRIAEGKFREELFLRLSVISIDLPPLRDHVEDLPELIGELTTRLRHQVNSTIRFDALAVASLQQHPWRGNVRELANLVERLSIIKPDALIGFADLPLQYRYQGGGECPAVDTEKSGSAMEPLRQTRD